MAEEAMGDGLSGRLYALAALVVVVALLPFALLSEAFDRARQRRREQAAAG